MVVHTASGGVRARLGNYFLVFSDLRRDWGPGRGESREEISHGCGGQCFDAIWNGSQMSRLNAGILCELRNGNGAACLWRHPGSQDVPMAST